MLATFNATSTPTIKNAYLKKTSLKAKQIPTGIHLQISK